MAETRRLGSLPLWERWNREALLKQQKIVGARAFARGFFLQAYTDEDRMFRSFPKCYSPGLRAKDVIARRYPTFIGLDPAGKKRKGTAIVAIALEPGTQRRIPVDVRLGAWTVPEMIRELLDMNRIHNVAYVMVENNALQDHIVDAIKTGTKGADSSLWFRVEPFNTGKNKSDETLGLPSLETEFFNGAWMIPSDEFESHEPGHTCAWCSWRNQLVNYPMWSDTDFALSTWFAREALSRWGNLGAGNTGSLRGLNER